MFIFIDECQAKIKLTMEFVVFFGAKIYTSTEIKIWLQQHNLGSFCQR